MQEIVKGIGLFFLDIIQLLVVTFATFILVYIFLFQPHQVKGSSMFPNFHDGEYILTDKISYRFGIPQRGNVIVFKAPKNEEIDYIKRIIGLPGDQVKVENESVFINGVKLEEKYLPSDYVTSAGSFMPEGVPATVPENSYFVLGDNRSHSSDSREWGFVTRKEIIGKAFFRYWPIPDIGVISYPSYNEVRAL